MKRVLLLVLVVGLLAGQAFGALYYTLDTTTAMKFTAGDMLNTLTPVDTGSLELVTTSFDDYGADTMLGKVGYIGSLWDKQDADNIATIRIHLPQPGNAGLSGSYDGLRAFLANDDDDPWGVRVFVKTTLGGGSEFYSGTFTTLLSGQSAWLTTEGSKFDFANVTDLGFDVRGTFGSNSPSNPDYFHISAVPVPAGVLLGFLGLTAAGLGLRKLA